MRKIFLLFLFFCSITCYGAQRDIQVVNLKTDNRVQPLGLGSATPFFSWQIMSEKQDLAQVCYRILVSTSPEKLAKDEGDLWDSGKVKSERQLWVAYEGVPLKSNQRAYWKVHVTTNKGYSSWSEPASFGIGLLTESQWRGRWIGMESLQADEERGLHTRLAARYLRKEFELSLKPIKQATVYVAGLGLYELHLNGQKVGDAMLTPTPSDYRKTIYYDTYDVTGLLTGQNTLGIVLGNGMYYPPRQDKPYKIPVFGLPKCRINMIVEYADGTKQRIVTDETWKVTSNGPIRANNYYDGEAYDEHYELTGWDQYGYDDSLWQKADRSDIPTGTLRGSCVNPIKVAETVSPQTITANKGGTIYDFGQNMTGVLTVRFHASEGDTLRLRFAETLTADGHLYTDNLRTAKQEDVYICAKPGTHVWTPTFVYHGFRYVEISGNIKMEDMSASFLADDMIQTGRFACSDSTLTKVFENAVRGIRSNYKGMPIDCPQRDERQPWLGDRTVGALGESYIFDNERLYSKWMHDIVEAQREDGCIPDVAPAFWNYYTDDVTWPAALPFICDMLYEQYGNLQVVGDCYEPIKRWLNHICTEYEKDGIITRDKYGDWCFPPESPQLIHGKDSTLMTDGSLIAIAYTIRSAQLMSRFARILGKDGEEAAWHEMQDRLTRSFNTHFLTSKEGTSPVPGHPLYPDSIYYGNNTATANLLALAFNLVPDSLRDEVAKQVVTQIITRHNGHISTGVIGTSWILRGLSDNGFSDVAYLLATNTTYPSWGYMAQQGATTIWELWNGDKADKAMNSGNHVMLLGDLITWCYQYLAGIRAVEPAYKQLSLKPAFEIQNCEWVESDYQTPYGTVSSRWKKTLQHIDWLVEIPVGTTATLHMPDGTVRQVGSGRHHLSADIPTNAPAILKEEFLYLPSEFPSCHAGTITELANGDLLAAYFGGKHENNPDVCIWISRKAKGENTWSKPVLAADGVFKIGTDQAQIAGVDESTTPANVGPILPRREWGDTTLLRRKACWNPVLYQLPDGETLLFYKVGTRVADWTGWLVRSHDNGKTWTDHEPLPSGFLGPIKNKPELIGSQLVCPSSTEKNGWKIHFELYDLDTKEWTYVGPVEAEEVLETQDMGVAGKKPQPIGCIQPSILRHADGRLQGVCRSRQGKVATSFSDDNGKTWSKVTLLDVPNNQSGLDAVTLQDGRHVMIYNNFPTQPGTKRGVRTPLSIAVSDDGTHWRHVVTLEDSPISEYSYPAIIQGADGRIHCVYTWRRQRMKYVEINLHE